MPSVSFSLFPHHIDAIRELAIRLQVSQSQVVRDALDQFFPECGADATDDLEASVQRSHGSSPAMAGLVRVLAGVHRELVELRQMVAHIDLAQSGRNQIPFSTAEPAGGNEALESSAN